MQKDFFFWPLEVTAGEVIYPPGSNHGPRRQQNLQLVMVHGGHMTVWIDKIQREVPAGKVAILFPGHLEYFSFSAQSETHHSWLHISLTEMPQELQQRLAELPWPLPISPSMLELTHQALALKMSPLPTISNMLKALGLEMLWLYIGEGELQLANSNSIWFHPAVLQAQHYIQSHLGQPLTLQIMADEVKISPAHLIRLFRTHLSSTPLNYVWEQRVKAGVELLTQTGLSIGLIAEHCGFQTSYHFSRRVRQLTGFSPSEIRHQHQLLPETF
jgi:AraC-like DNA-binding protein